MKRAKLLVAVFAALASGLVSAPARAQALVGRCVDQARGQSFAVLSNFYMIQDGNPGNAGFAVRDPSGMAFLRIPAVLPWEQAFFVGWQGEVIEVHRQFGWRMVGQCQFQSGILRNNPNKDIFQPPTMHSDAVVETPNGPMRLPERIVDADHPFGTLMMADEGQALQCWRGSGGDKGRFGDCMVRAMAGSRERAVYECARAGGGQEAVAFCMVGALGGQQERQIASALAECRQRYGTDYSRYPLCLASGQVGGDAGKLLACVQQQAQRGQVTVMDTAMCYGKDSLELNPEMQIAVQCAVGSRGEPLEFAGCAGGQLTARELDKCFRHGVGGPDGCFGPNNTIVQALGAIGGAIGQQFGPGNSLVQAWNGAVNDLRKGPGKNHVAVKTLRDVGNEVGRTGGNIAREVSKVVPRIKIKW